MLTVKKLQDAIEIVESEDFGSQILRKPIHRLFLRGSLGGVASEDLLKYTLPFASVDTLNRLSKHFSKYNIDLSFDYDCLGLLENQSREKERFETLLKSATLIKQNPIIVHKDQLSKLLKPEFKRTLKDTQLKALEHILTIENGANFSVPGSGKTSVALAYYHLLKKLKIVDRIFIIGPASVFDPWEQEYEKCFEIKPKSLRLAGLSREKRKTLYLQIDSTELFLNTYHSSSRDIGEIKILLNQKKFLLVLDESHYIKKPTGGKLSDTVLELAAFATRRLILTGTPMPNSLADLWSQITFLWINELPLGPVNNYINEISKDDSDDKFNQIKNKIFPYFLRVTKSQLKLPDPKIHFIRVELSPMQSIIYKGVAAKYLMDLDISYKDKLVFRELRRARYIRLLQIASNPILLRKNCEEFLVPEYDSSKMDIDEVILNYHKIEQSSKVTETIRLANELIQSGKKVIIWSTFIQNLFMLNKLLNEFNPVVIYGGIPYENEDDIEGTREALIERFKTDPKCKIFIANPAACAESISLHMVCHNAIYLDRSFNCAHYIQSLDRIHRLGLSDKDQINYYIIMSNGTIDEVVEERLSVKIKNMNHVIEGDLPGIIPGYWSNDLGEEEIQDFESVENHIRKLFNK